MKNINRHLLFLFVTFLWPFILPVNLQAMPEREYTLNTSEEEIIAAGTDLESFEEAGWDDPENWRSMEISAAGTQSYSDFSHKTTGNATIRKGVDVSSHNETIDWNKVASSGVEFAIIRGAYRGYKDGSLNTDTYFARNISGAKAAGLKVGVYIFSQAITVEEGREEANYVLDRVRGYQIDLPIVIDFEYAYDKNGNIGRLTSSIGRRTSTDICKEFCRIVENAGYSSMVYANKSTLNNNLSASEFGRVWLAHYTSSTNYNGDYEYWQCSETGNVNGISGNTDLDFWYDNASDIYTPGVYRVSTSSGSKLMLREGPGTGYDLMDRVPNGTELQVTEVSGGWGKTSYGEKTGWVSLDNCTRIGDLPGYYTLDINGLLDDRISGSLESYGTADVYINGELVADDVSDYCESLAEGTTFKFTDFKAHDGYIYSGFDGYLSGIISGGSAELKVIFYTAGKAMSSGYNRTIPDGDYLICAAGTTNKSTFYFLDIEGTDQPAANETNVSLCGPLDYDPLSYEAWTLTFQDGFYTIKQAGTNMCLDIYGGSAIQGKNAQVYTSNDSAAQKWAVCENGRDGYRIQAKCSGLSLDIDGGLIENGRNVRQWKNNDTAAQSWLFIPYNPSQPIESGRYILMSALSDHLEFDVDGDTGDVPENVNIQVWENSAPSKYNSFDIQKLSNGYYKFTHAASGKCLDVSNGTSGYSDNIALHTDNGSPAQQWAIIPNGGGYCIVAKCSGYAIDVAKGSTENGANVLEYPIHGANNQIWRFVPAEYTVKYDANGGTGAPENQTKYYKENLNLSASEPRRNGYEFLGWAKTKTAVTAQFMPGEIYSNDINVTFYAVWEKLEPDFVLPNALTQIEEEAFEGGSFTYVKLSENTTTIRSKAFANCQNLTHIYIPEATTTIAADAFSGVDKSLCIHGTDGSYAEFYAGKYGFQFVKE